MIKRTLFGGLLAASVIVTPALAHEVTHPRALAERQVAGQVEAWNRGDLEGALSTYCPSADVTWVNSSGVSRGFDGFRRGMQSMFGGGLDKMGTLDVQVADTRLFGDGSNLTVVRWSITRGGSRLMGGISTQLWADCDGKMRIVFEHSS